jgi:hypothetical protein
MKDSMHQIDLSIIIRFIMAIFKKYWESVLQFLREGMEVLAANRLAARFCKALDCRAGPDV